MNYIKREKIITSESSSLDERERPTGAAAVRYIDPDEIRYAYPDEASLCSLTRTFAHQGHFSFTCSHIRLQTVVRRKRHALSYCVLHD